MLSVYKYIGPKIIRPQSCNFILLDMEMGPSGLMTLLAMETKIDLTHAIIHSGVYIIVDIAKTLVYDVMEVTVVMKVHYNHREAKLFALRIDQVILLVIRC